MPSRKTLGDAAATSTTPPPVVPISTTQAAVSASQSAATDLTDRVTVYSNRERVNAAKALLATEGNGRSYSRLVDDLVAAWIDRQQAAQ